MFRFEVLATVLVIASWRLWFLQDLEGSAALLGLVTTAKIYHCIILSLLLSSAYVESGMARVVRVVVFFALGLMMIGSALPLG